MTRRNIIIAILVLVGLIVCVCVGIFGAVTISDQLDPAGATALRVTFTAQAASAATATSIAGATATADIARLDTKELLLEENFDSGTPKLTFSCEAKVENGVVHTTIDTRSTCFSLIGVDVTDFAAEVQCDARGDDAECGLVFDSQGASASTNGSYYAVYLSGSNCWFAKVPSDGPSYSGPFKCADRATGQANLLHVERLHDTLRIFIDGVKEDEFVLDQPVITHGDLGVLIGANPGDGTAFPNIDITVDNVKFWKVP